MVLRGQMVVELEHFLRWPKKKRDFKDLHKIGVRTFFFKKLRKVSRFGFFSIFFFSKKSQNLLSRQAKKWANFQIFTTEKNFLGNKIAQKNAQFFRHFCTFLQNSNEL